MEIKLLKLYSENKEKLELKRLANPDGLSVERIEEIELKINSGKPFPQSFREYLFIGGEYSALGINPWYGASFEDEEGENFIKSFKKYNELMKNNGLTINRPFIIFKDGDDSSFDFIYLDEGDDPRPRFFYLDDNLMGNDERIGNYPEKTFSELIDRLVDYALRGLVPF